MHSISEIGTNVPAFLGKLWKMVEDPLTNDLISWCSLGDSFVIKDATRLARELLPMYYKHNNMASFIRQLNMYGFHKIVSSDCKQDVTEMKFTHPHFIRGHPYLLEKIKRKVGDITVTRGPEKPTIMNKMLNDVKQMKGKQDSLDSRLITMKRENEALWRELSHMRQKHKKQQHIVNKLIQYLVILIQTNHLPVTRRGFPLMLRDKAGHHSSVDENTNSPTGPVIHELESADVLLEDVDSSIAPTVSSSDTSSDVFSPDVDIEGEILTTNDIEVMKDEFPEDFLTVADKTIPVDIQNLTSLSNDQEDVIVNVPNVTAKIQPKTKKRLNRSVIKTQAKKQKKESTPLHFVVTNTDNGNFVVVPNDIYIPPENETLPPVTNVNDGSPLEVTLSPGIVTQDWTTSSPTPVLNPTKDTLISTPIVEDILSPVTAETVLPNPISTEPSVDILPCGISDLELNNMQVARVDSGKNGNYINRFGRLEDIDSHLGSVQADLDSFKELLKNEGISLDANALLGFLNEESMPLISNSGEDYMNSFSKQKDLEGNELIMYNPSIFDLSDITSEPDEWILPDTNDTELSLQDDVFKEVGLNTPQFAMNSPSFPTSAKTTKT